MKRVGGALWITFNSPDAVPRFFGTTADDDIRAWAFFGMDGIKDAQPESVG